MRRLTIVAGVLAGVVVLGGGAFALFHDDETFTVSRYRAMCDKPHGFKQAAARSATQPHPVFVYGYWNVREDHPEAFGAGALDVWDPADPAKVQLVACVDTAGRGAFVKRCDYTAQSGPIDGPLGGPGGPTGNYSVDLYKTEFRVTLYAARTGARVATARFSGDRFGADEDENGDPCSPATVVHANDPRGSVREGTPYIRQIRDALTPYVTH
ncbi:hypothetical protein [Actinoallomurus iriomotensis]|uniref:Uncharacterized protein n=1 Tax=Actinoallomurus iriomotensis TaxID=478107 RepID=A0A9W6RL04_9ACTN|nr:hypothetical protein [Actinoallomurus iriomotensis]GLY77628.1 hypothetical protein Airi01_058950 [Actinoallomurus iriomotensis]